MQFAGKLLVCRSHRVPVDVSFTPFQLVCPPQRCAIGRAIEARRFARPSGFSAAPSLGTTANGQSHRPVKKLSTLVSQKGADLLLSQEHDSLPQHQRLRVGLDPLLWKWKTVCHWQWKRVTGMLPEHISWNCVHCCHQ